MSISRNCYGFMLAFCCFFTGQANSADVFDKGKLLMTGAVSQVEGAGGSGLVNWALITGYGSEQGVGVNAHHTYVALRDFTLNSTGVAVGFYDRFELSAARQWFDTGEAGARLGLGEGYSFGQDIIGAKVRVFGDALYTQDSWMPQVAIGAQYKNAKRSGLLAALGAKDDEDVDFYVTATKAYLAQSLILTGSVRFTRANQYGLLGFGAAGQGRSTQFEGSAAYMLRHNLILGADYRTKPDNLAFAEETDAAAVYAAYFFNKNLSLTVAAVDLGHIALQGRQRGLYLSLQAGF